MPKTLALFDFDGTITKKDTFVQFVFFAKGFMKASAGFLLFSPLIALFLVRILDSGKVKLRLFSFLFKGYSKYELQTLGDNFSKYIFNKDQIRPEMRKKLDQYKNEKADIYIVSASLDIWINPIAEKLSVKYICTEADYNGDQFQGRYKTKNCNRKEKADRIKKELDLDSYKHIVAFGNSSGDKQMLELAHQSHRVES